MAICAFLGNNNVYSDTLCPQLRETLKKLMETEGSLEFLLAPQYGTFYSLCLKVALEVKSHYRDRTTITLVVGCKNDLECIVQKYNTIPLCAIVCVRVANIPNTTGPNFYRTKYNLWRFIIQHCTHVVCCVYERFYETLPNKLMAFAQKMPTTELIDISDIEIVKEIECQLPSLLTDREKLVLERSDSGHTYKEIGAEIGASIEWTRQVKLRAGQRIRKFIEQYCKKRRIMGSRNRKLMCAIFALDNPSPEKVKAFRQIIERMILDYNVTLFEIPGKYYRSPFAKILIQKKRYYHFYLSAVVTDEYCLKTGNDERYILERFSPPADCVKNIDTTLMSSGTMDCKMIAGMIEQADFCICDLSTSPIAKEIRELISQHDHVSLLDIGRSFSPGAETNST